jgi:hypothetical protein
MKTRTLLVIAPALLGTLLIGLFLALPGTAAPAQQSAPLPYSADWHVVAGGGNAMASAEHQVRSTLGQVSSGPAARPGGHAAGLGYWYGIQREPAGFDIYLPLVVRGT